MCDDCAEEADKSSNTVRRQQAPGTNSGERSAPDTPENIIEMLYEILEEKSPERYRERIRQLELLPPIHEKLELLPVKETPPDPGQLERLLRELERERDSVGVPLFSVRAVGPVVRAKSINEGGTSAESASPATTKAIASLGPGKPMPPTERAFFEPRFGVDFSGVRVHDDAAADRAARAMGARAFTLGAEIAFARSETRDGSAGRHLMAHELAHVVQGGNVLRRAPCTSRTAENSIISSHTVPHATIQSPGDEAEIIVTFSCRPRSLTSEIVDAGNNVVKSEQATIWNGKLTLRRTGAWTVRWDGKRAFPNIGTYMAADGAYRHRISNVAYAVGPQGDRIAAGGGVLSTSPQITVSTRARISTGPAAHPSRHLYGAAGAKLEDNVRIVAEAIAGEAGGYNDSERAAIAWAIRNEMAAINSYSAAAADRAFNFTNRTPTDADRTLAESILSQDLANDPTSGAIKWYSPRSMPPNRGRCRTDGGDGDCGGGLVTLASDPQRSSYAPTFHTYMTYVTVPGVREWNFRFYRL
jgi:hypothetical protein